MNERRRLIKNTGIIAIGNISTKLVSFFLLPLYTAVLSTAEYGAMLHNKYSNFLCSVCFSING